MPIKQTSRTTGNLPVSTNAFVGQKEEPTEHQLDTALGRAREVWDRFLAELAQEHGVTIQEWKCYSVKMGWSLRVKRGKRTIVWLSPREGCFGVVFIFGAKAMSAVQQCKLPKRVTKAIGEATKYPEGYGVRLEVKTSQDINALKRLVAIKLAN